MRILATLLQADAGRATIDGDDVVSDAGKVRRTIGLTGQYASVDEDLTGIQNLPARSSFLADCCQGAHD